MKITQICLISASIFASVSIFIGCTDSDSGYDAHYESCKDVADLSEFQENFGSYKLEKKIPFKHSNGYTFYMEVTQCDRGADDFCNMRQTITLESSYPIYTINLTSSQKSTYLEPSKIYGDTLAVSFGQYRFTLKNPKADSSRIDTLILNKIAYTDVAVAIGRKVKQTEVIPAYISSSNEVEETVESDAKLYYQSKKGILKIEMEDGSYIVINEKEKK